MLQCFTSSTSPLPGGLSIPLVHPEQGEEDESRLHRDTQGPTGTCRDPQGHAGTYNATPFLIPALNPGSAPASPAAASSPGVTAVPHSHRPQLCSAGGVGINKEIKGIITSLHLLLALLLNSLQCCSASGSPSTPALRPWLPKIPFPIHAPRGTPKKPGPCWVFTAPAPAQGQRQHQQRRGQVGSRENLDDTTTAPCRAGILEGELLS